MVYKFIMLMRLLWLRAIFSKRFYGTTIIEMSSVEEIALAEICYNLHVEK